MNEPVIQYFATSGTWVKPERAVRVDIVLRGAQGGGFTAPMYAAAVDAEFTRARLGGKLSPYGYIVSNGEPGEIRVSSYDAADLPDMVEVEVGKGGRPGGYALIVTHLAAGKGHS